MKNTFAKKFAAAAIACAIAASPAIALAQTPHSFVDRTNNYLAVVAQEDGYDHALRVALDHAGVTWGNAHNCSMYYSEMPDGTPVYVVEFETDEHFYGFSIHAETFQVVESYVS